MSVTETTAFTAGQTKAAPFRPDDVLRFLEHSWPLAGIGFAVAVNAAWIGFLGYCIFQLI
jgi:hypothetical protein